MSTNNYPPISELVKKQQLSFITSFNQKAETLTRHGKNVIKLSGGDPSHYPEKLLSIMEELSQALDKSIFNYSPIEGFSQLRELLALIIAPRYCRSYSKDNILICSGGCSGLFLVLKTLLNAGDRVLVQNPCWEYLPRLIENCGGVPVKTSFLVKPSVEINWEQLLNEIEQYLQTGVKVVTINSPLNPSGTIIPVVVKNNLVQLCEQYGAWVMSDDVTTDFNYIEPNPSVINNTSFFISINSFSKNLGITGLRFGFVAGCERFINQLKKSQLYTFMYPNSLIQRLMEHYLSCGLEQYYDFINNITSLYKLRAKEYADIFSAIAGLEILQPDGGLFLFPQVKPPYQLDCKKLLEQYHVAVSPGEAFGSECKDYFRVFLGADKSAVLQACEIIKEALLI